MSRQRIVILGAAESGVGAAVLAKLRGYEVFVSDQGKIKDAFKSVLQQYEIPYEEGIHTVETVMAADEIIKSPGISEKVPLIQQIRAAGISIISEIEFASRFTKSTIIAITGTNGKSTTTSLIWHMLKRQASMLPWLVISARVSRSRLQSMTVLLCSRDQQFSTR